MEKIALTLEEKIDALIGPTLKKKLKDILQDEIINSTFEKMRVILQKEIDEILQQEDIRTFIKIEIFRYLYSADLSLSVASQVRQSIDRYFLEKD